MTSADPLKGYIIVPYSKKYKDLRQSFDCGVIELNEYLKKTASRDIKKRACTLFVALSPQKDRICGYYTLSMSSINLPDVPSELRNIVAARSSGTLQNFAKTRQPVSHIVGRASARH